MVNVWALRYRNPYCPVHRLLPSDHSVWTADSGEGLTPLGMRIWNTNQTSQIYLHTRAEQGGSVNGCMACNLKLPESSIHSVVPTPIVLQNWRGVASKRSSHTTMHILYHWVTKGWNRFWNVGNLSSKLIADTSILWLWLGGSSAIWSNTACV